MGESSTSSDEKESKVGSDEEVQLNLVKEMILMEFGELLSKKGRQYLRENLKDFETAMKMFDALSSLYEDKEGPSSTPSKSQPNSPSSNMSSESSSAAAATSTPIFSSEASTSPTSSSKAFSVESSRRLPPSSKFVSGGTPLLFRQYVVRSKLDESNPPKKETVAYEQVFCKDPPKRTPTKRLNRREVD